MTDQEAAGQRALRLLCQGYTPEEVEDILDGAVRQPTALSDPTNVLMQEVTEDDAV